MIRIVVVAALLQTTLGLRLHNKNKKTSDVTTQIVTVPGRACNGGPAFRARVFYPSAGSDFPIFSFAHGGPQGQPCTMPWCPPQDIANEYSQLLEPIAAAGYFVIAFTECADPSRNGYKELIDSITWLRTRAGFPVDLALPAAIAGHSAGGWAALRAASEFKELQSANVGLALTMHPGSFGFTYPLVPTVYWTGEIDEQSSPSSLRSMYDQVDPSMERAFGVFSKHDHNAPRNDTAGYIAWSVKWMDCKILNENFACGQRASMCRSGDFGLCEIEVDA